MAAMQSTSFSPGGEYFAHCTADGRLKIWETATGTLQQEYTPSAHLAASCTCLSWSPAHHKPTLARRKKKRKSELNDTASELGLIALGTLNGNILLYSVVKGDLQSQMVDGGHSGKVNSISWNIDTDSIYSASDDFHIVEWSIQSGFVKRKWKYGHGGVTSLCLLSDQSLMSASRKIHWWDLDKHKTVRKFSGHATEVMQLLHVSYPKDPPDSGYLISAAADDRYLNAWLLNKDSKDKGASATFALREEPVFIDITTPTSRDQSLLLTAVTKSGLLQVFEHHLNGRCKEPLSPTVSITIATSDEEIPKTIPIISAQLCNDENRNILIAYGNSVRLGFEKLPFSSSEKEICLPRRDPSKFNVTIESTKTKIKQPHVGKVKMLVPGHMMASGPTELQKKRKRDGPVYHQLPMEERLSVLTIDQQLSVPSGSSVPRALNMSNLLEQGLRSNDEEMLSNVLLQNDDQVIGSTVPRLPVHTVIPLLKELQRRIHVIGSLNHGYLKWIRSILTTHTSYLLACRDLETMLGSFYQLLDARTQMFEKMSRLQGRMNLILTQIKSKRNDGFSPLQSKAVLVYDDDSSDGEGVDEEKPEDDEMQVEDDDTDNEVDENSENEEVDENKMKKWTKIAKMKKWTKIAKMKKWMRTIHF
uniref:Small-subunit processome Utp12 domain-containing protein n=1 Tax=Strigamia maritima TaxID=126957 RepID=T1IMG5_STRMM